MIEHVNDTLGALTYTLRAILMISVTGTILYYFLNTGYSVHSDVSYQFELKMRQAVQAQQKCTDEYIRNKCVP